MSEKSLADFVASRKQSVARIKREVRPLLPSASSPALSLPKEDQLAKSQGPQAAEPSHKATSGTSEARTASAGAEVPEEAASAKTAEKAFGQEKSPQQQEVASAERQPGKDSSTVAQPAGVKVNGEEKAKTEVEKPKPADNATPAEQARLDAISNLKKDAEALGRSSKKHKKGLERSVSREERPPAPASPACEPAAPTTAAPADSSPRVATGRKNKKGDDGQPTPVSPSREGEGRPRVSTARRSKKDEDQPLMSPSREGEGRPRVSTARRTRTDEDQPALVEQPAPLPPSADSAAAPVAPPANGTPANISPRTSTPVADGSPRKNHRHAEEKPQKKLGRDSSPALMRGATVASFGGSRGSLSSPSPLVPPSTQTPSPTVDPAGSSTPPAGTADKLRRQETRKLHSRDSSPGLARAGSVSGVPGVDAEHQLKKALARLKEREQELQQMEDRIRSCSAVECPHCHKEVQVDGAQLLGKARITDNLLANSRITKRAVALHLEYDARLIVRCQRIARHFIMRRRFMNLTKDFKNHSSSLYLRLRNETIKEIIESERKYIGSLDALRKGVVVPLENSTAGRGRPILTRQEIYDIFSNIELIVDLHEELLRLLQERILEWPSKTHFGDIFLKMIPIMKLYSMYIRNYDRATECLVNLRKTNERWVAFLKDPEVLKALGTQTIDSYLIMPVQRLPRYQMLLAQLLKYTPAEHVDHANIKASLARVQEVVTAINERARAEHDRAALQQLETEVGGLSLWREGRRLLDAIPCSAAEKGFGDHKLEKERVFYLLNDMILVVKKSKNFVGESVTLKTRIDLAPQDKVLVSASQEQLRIEVTVGAKAIIAEMADMGAFNKLLTSLRSMPEAVIVA